MPDQFTTSQGPVTADGLRCHSCGVDGKDQGGHVQCPVCGVLLTAPDVSDTPIFDDLTATHATVQVSTVEGTVVHGDHTVTTEETDSAPAEGSGDVTVGVATVEGSAQALPPE